MTGLAITVTFIVGVVVIGRALGNHSAVRNVAIVAIVLGAIAALVVVGGFVLFAWTCGPGCDL